MAHSSKQPVSLARQLILACFFIALGVPLVGQSFVNVQVVKEQRSVLKWMGPETAEAIATRANKWYSAWALNTGLYDQANSIGSASGKLVDKAGAALFSKTVADANTECVVGESKYAVRDSAGRFSNDPCDTQQLQLGDSAGRVGNEAPINHQGATVAGPDSELATVLKPGGRPAGGLSIESVFKRWVLGAFGVLYFAGYRLSLLLVWLPLLVPIIFAILLEGDVRRKLKHHSYGGLNALHYRGGVRLSSWGSAFAIAIFFAPGALPPVAVPVMFVLVALGFAMWTANMTKPT